MSEAATANEANADIVSVVLRKPVTFKDETYSVLTFREPEVGDLLIGDQFNGQLAKMTAVLASLSDVPFQAFKKIKSADFKVIVTKTSALLGNDAEEMEATTGE